MTPPSRIVFSRLGCDVQCFFWLGANTEHTLRYPLLTTCEAHHHDINQQNPIVQALKSRHYRDKLLGRNLIAIQFGCRVE
jgi:hypothetical protein